MNRESFGKARENIGAEVPGVENLGGGGSGKRPWRKPLIHDINVTQHTASANTYRGGYRETKYYLLLVS